MIVTKGLPCFNGSGQPPIIYDYTGHVVGSFFIHRRGPDQLSRLHSRGDWMVTHTATGFSLGGRPRGKARAIRLAKELEALNCWDFSDPQEAKLIPAEKLALIAELKRRI